MKGQLVRERNNSTSNIERNSSCILTHAPKHIFVLIFQLALGSILMTSSAAISTTYSDTLSNNSSKFIRPDCTTGDYYYQAIQVTLFENGTFVFSSRSTANTFGCLYKNEFNPSNPFENLIASNDNDAGDNQFRISMFLETENSYILVVTTFHTNVFGEFLIEVNGDNQVGLTRLISLASTLLATTVSTVSDSSSSYTNTLSMHDQTFTRPNGFGNLFYFKSLQVSVFTSGIYTLTGSSSINIQGVLYNNSFTPSRANRNIIAGSYGIAASKQFRFNARLQSAGTYILIITSHRSGDMGNFTIIVNGSARPYFDLLVSTTVTYGSSLSMSDNTMHRLNGNESNYYYKPITVRVAVNGIYVFSSTSNVDLFGVLYDNSFNPARANQGLITYDDNSNDNNQFVISAYLQTTEKYVLLVTTHNSNTLGQFLIAVNGPSKVNVSLFIPSTAMYGGILSSRSSVFARPNQNTSDYDYYYQAIELIVPVTGTYILTSNSSMDMYGCLYAYLFDPSFPNTALECSDNEGGGEQFLITHNLLYARDYILVVTTFSPHTTGSYWIEADGPGELILSSVTISTTSTKPQNPSPSEKSKLLIIIGAIIGSIVVVLIVGIFVYRRRRKAEDNQTPIPRKRSEIRTETSLPMVRLRSDTRGSTVSEMRYSAAETTTDEGYLNPLSPSYDDYVTSSRRPNQGSHVYY